MPLVRSLVILKLLFLHPGLGYNRKVIVSIAFIGKISASLYWPLLYFKIYLLQMLFVLFLMLSNLLNIQLCIVLNNLQFSIILLLLRKSDLLIYVFEFLIKIFVFSDLQRALKELLLNPPPFLRFFIYISDMIYCTFSILLSSYF